MSKHLTNLTDRAVRQYGAAAMLLANYGTLTKLNKQQELQLEMALQLGHWGKQEQQEPGVNPDFPPITTRQGELMIKMLTCAPEEFDDYAAEARESITPEQKLAAGMK